MHLRLFEGDYKKNLDLISLNSILAIFLCVILVTANFSINYTISGMSIFGTVASASGFFLILYSLYTKNLIGVLSFLILNSIIGPFSLFNLYSYGFGTFGRLDYLVSFFVFALFIFLQKNINLFIFFLIFVVIGSFLLHDDFSSLLSIKVYSNVSIIMQTYVLFVIIKNFLLGDLQDDYDFFLKIMIFILILNVTLAYFQIFFFGFHIRQSATMGFIEILGFLINRPTGLYGSAHVFSLSTLMLIYVIYVLLSPKSRVLFRNISVFTVFPLMFLSSSAVFLGILIYLFCYVFFNKCSTPLKVLLFFSLFLILIFILNTFHISDLSKSTGTKVLIWWLIIKDTFLTSNFIEIIFGHGIDTAKHVSQKIPDFLMTYKYGFISYDHEILKRDGFIYPHNIFIQIFYEYGLILFLPLSIITIKNLFFAINYKSFSMLNLIFITSFINYFFHNGIFSITFLPFLLLIAYARRNKSCKLLI